MKKNKKYSVILGVVMLVSAFCTSCSGSYMAPCSCAQNGMIIPGQIDENGIAFDEDLAKRCQDYAMTLSSDEQAEWYGKVYDCL